MNDIADLEYQREKLIDQLDEIARTLGFDEHKGDSRTVDAVKALMLRLSRALIAMDPRRWGFAGENDLSARWHRAIPDIQAAFNRLRAWVMEDDNFVVRGDEYHGIYPAPGCDCGEPGHDGETLGGGSVGSNPQGSAPNLPEGRESGLSSAAVERR